MKIRAAVLETIGAPQPFDENRPLTIEELELDPPGDHEVLVQIRAAGLCHSDLSVIDGNRPRPVPMALGHEAAGVVKAVGAGVTDLSPGDHVVTVFVPSCGHCSPCAEGRPALCEPAAVANNAGTLVGGEHRLHRADGTPVNHHLGVSAFADHAVVSRHSLVRIDPDLPFHHAALFGCAVLTGVGAAINSADIKAGQTVAVIGLGGVGLNSVLGALVAGAGQVIAIDLDEDKLAMAKSLGASAGINAADEDCVSQVKALTNGGVDCAIEMAGSEKALELAYQLTRRGGTTVTGGLAHPDRKVSIQQVSLVAEERTLKGSYVGSCVPVRDVARYVSLFRQGRLPVDKLLSDTLTLDEINEGFERLANGKAIRQVILFDDH
ncbi:MULTISPECIES: zinc-dependent alcohol dehydrogenase family protein [Marinobacter]|jgi:alcohol dehydrogenase|uniref:Alcohol dehydrogenase n=5 Tax=Marinobacter TaxID=2742 RepID=W5YRV7_9GAMM|nr:MULTISPECIES: zinc-dependent alcohol dehydrogenase family protein [Marinobacter]AHI31780.1 alcohol dehydrogenase [Marinobacter salarius]ARM83228.1 putative alcohol dehydrogenase D [Marinobacter salarius]AZR42062.1 alcohol dehydrogenase [Marinobacter salarius]EDM48844.1 alcohol dehydrogenase [Marinobacter algicola DG893]KXJ48475.1 MAG: alcohol dehydrogenase [Marinobacter sp. Hex_13]|tara:strand:+ start:864 stop:2000 length:1137 start_codon:yes stop_codon:yes gene_type:complete